jgi:hypothetical protein
MKRTQEDTLEIASPTAMGSTPSDLDLCLQAAPPLFAPTEPNPDYPNSSAVIGAITGLTEMGEPLVVWPEAPGGSAVVARTVLPLSPQTVGREVVLIFERGEPGKPIVMGLIQPLPSVGSRPEYPNSSGTEPFEVTVDGQKVAVSAREEMVLRCGKASITLTRAGKVLIRGAYLLTRSSGVNRIKGGSVQIN